MILNAVLRTDFCDVYENLPVVNERGVTEFQRSVTSENIPCRVSFGRLRAADDTETDSSAEVTAKLFVGADVCIPAGSLVKVRRGECEYMFECSGIPAVYSGHKEIMLVCAENGI